MEPTDQNPAVNFDPGVVDFMLEMGPNVCSSVEECRATLASLGPGKFTAQTVARIMHGMVKAQEALNISLGGWGEEQSLSSSIKAMGPKGDGVPSWNGKNFVQAVLEIVPTLLWKEVFHELDFPGFSIKDGRSFRSLMEALTHGLELQNVNRPDQFPIETIYRKWNNTEGQLNFIKCALNPKNSDVFSFADFPYHPTTVDMLKSTGPADKNLTDMKDIAIWKSIELLELLLFLSDAGHYSTIQELFHFPVNHCPDILLVGLIQLTSPMNMLRQELMASLFPIFLGNHVNSALILQYAWHTPNTLVRPIMIHAMAEWYLRSGVGEVAQDQTKLSRILDLAQDLKALSALLNATSSSSFVFIIELACLASRREFLKLDKWLSDKGREHGEPFISSIIKVLNKRAPYLFGKEENLPKTAILPQETTGTIIQCLHQYVGKVSHETSEMIVNISSTYNLIMTKSRAANPPPHQPPGVLRPPNFNVAQSPTFPPTSDSLSGLSGNLSNLNLGGGPPPPAVAAAAASGFGPPPGSPSRLIHHNFSGAGTPGSNYPGLPMPPPIGPPPSNLPTVNPIGILGGRLSGNLGSLSVSTGDNRSQENAQLFGGDQPDISKEAEDEANSYFHRIYSKPPDPSMSIDEVLDHLKRFQDSTVRREREVFNCMLRNLFGEYKFFPQYPEQELQTTAQLFGGIIEHGLVSSYLQLGVALRFVVDALKKPPGQKIYYFGLTALDRFKARLKEYPQYCQHLSSIQHFSEFPPELQEYVDFGARSQEPPRARAARTTASTPQNIPTTTPTTGQAKTSTTTSIATTPGKSAPGPVLSGRPSIANATNINTLLVATEKENSPTPPPENVQDKTAFIFNNLNQMNLTQKCEELKEVIGADHWPWIAHYLVLKRASLELNFHTLYSNLLDTLKTKELNSHVLSETHRNIKILLRTDKSAGNFADRTLLKNLGHWLGMITLMKNRPIILDDLDIKSLVIESYRKGIQDLLYVVPFAAKIMESCSRSLVFKPPCPWTMSILNVLAELHREPEMKLNLKFEIEVLCKALTIEVSDLKPYNILKDETAFKIMVPQLSYVPPIPKAIEKAPRGREALPQRTQQLPLSETQSIPTPVQQTFSKAPSQPIPDHHAQSNSVAVSQSFNRAFEDSVGSLVSPGMDGGLGTNISPPSTGLPSTTLQEHPAEPKFHFQDVDTKRLENMMIHLIINNSIALFQSHPNLKRVIKQALEKAIQDLLQPVVERSIKYTVNACEQIIKKDFALDPDENKMRMGSHHMMRSIVAGMAMITSRDHIFIVINSSLKNAFLADLRASNQPNPSQAIKDLVDQASATIAQDNMELASVIIQKTAVEKGLVEIDKRLAPEYETRKQAKLEGRRYCDAAMMNYQIERIPEPVRAKPSGGFGSLLSVYEDFSKNIPGFILPLEGEIPFVSSSKFSSGSSTPIPQQQQQAISHPSSVVPTSAAQVNAQNVPAPAADDITAIYDKLAVEMENYAQAFSVAHSPAAAQLAAGIRTISDCVIVSRTTRSVVSAIALLTKAVEQLLEGFSAFPTDPEIMRFRDAHLMVLKSLQDGRAFGTQWVNRQVTKCLMESRNEFKFNIEPADALIRAGLVNMMQFDAHLASSMEKGTNPLVMNFAMQLVQMYLVDERFNNFVNESDLYHTVDMLAKCATLNRQQPEGLIHLLDVVRNNHEAPNLERVQTTNNIQSGISQSREFDDPQGLVEKSEILLREWIRLFMTQGTPKDSNKAFTTFIHELNASGILKSDDVITRFFRISVQCCVNQVYQGLQTGAISLIRGKCYQSVDALVRLVALLIKHIGENVNVTPKINLLNKFLGIVAGLLIQDHDLQKTEFQQLPFHRLFIILFYDLNVNDPIFETISMQILTGFSNTLHIVSPSKVPGFAFAWLEIIGNRTFVSRMLALASDSKCWAMYCQLLLDLFKFLNPYLRNAELAKPVSTLYRGTLRILLVILHDFPDFLCDYCYHFLDAIPPNCIQMRNLVLSAFPRNMRLPDPFTANLRVELLADTSLPPRILSNVAGFIQPASFKKDLDSYLKKRAPVTFLSELRTNLQVANDPGTRYNIPLMNALVLYVGAQHIGVIRARGQVPTLSTVAHISHMDIFQNLAVDLDTEGRYLFLNALGNQLRFPSSHTHYFSLVILYLFSQSNTEVVQEQITRVLLERLVVNRPHPWGLLVTFIELIKNPTYKFWQHEFVHCAPEVEKLFESVARSCMVTKNAQVTGTSAIQSNSSSGSLSGAPGSNGGSMLDNASDALNIE